MPGGLLGLVLAEQFGDDVEGGVDPCVDACRRDDLAVVEEADALTHGRIGGHLPQQVDGSVVRRRRQAVDSPAWASSNAPVQTDRTTSAFAAARPIQPTKASLFISLRVPWPPGTTRRSGAGQSASRWCGLTLMPFLASTGPGLSATVKTLNEKNQPTKTNSTRGR